MAAQADKAKIADDVDLTEIIGADIGDGEFAFALAMLTDKDAPTMLEVRGERSQVTAVLYFPSFS
jgi:hypothetical protein